ncbi:hypothetical protein P3S68_008999 [Capsicum galapagoense]
MFIGVFQALWFGILVTARAPVRIVTMSFTDQDESWSLFKSAALPSAALPSEFETAGQEIAEKCQGLPLIIVVAAGLLKSKRAIEDWENIAKDVKSFVTNDLDELCSHVLGLSYNHMTSDLKACLLHFGIFPEDSEIPAKKLMRSWMAEGFLQLENDLEGEAEKCLQELVDRCLVLISKKSLDGTKIRSCKCHDSNRGPGRDEHSQIVKARGALCLSV